MPTYRLLQAREQGDPVRTEEHEAFATRLGISPDDIEPYDLLEGTCSYEAATTGVRAVLVGGSGRFSIYDDEPWLAPFVSTLGELAAKQFPTFASCFGFQGLVVALGGLVEKDEANAEVGTYTLEVTPEASDDPVFAGLPAQFDAQLGHKDRATRMPDGVVLLARSVRCPYQAFRLGHQVYATQFHPELDRAANRFRFSRYFEPYSKVFGPEAAQSMMDGFRPSPEADALLVRFAALPWNR